MDAPHSKPRKAPGAGSLALAALTMALLLSACGSGPAIGPASSATEPETMMEPRSDVAPGPAELPGTRAGPVFVRSGVLTAGDIDDALNLDAYRRTRARVTAETGLPQADLSAAVLLAVTGPDGAPAPGVPVTLRLPGAVEPFHRGVTGVDGRVTVFPAVHGAGRPREVDLRAFPAGDGPVFRRMIRTGERRQPLELPFVGRWEPDFLDLVFVVDATGSMGDELDWLKRDLRRMTKAARDTDPGLSIRYGLVMYRDQGDDYVVRNYGFTRRESQMLGWLRAQEASGGGDYPEAAAEALRAAVGLGWRRGQGERLLIHIADAPPHARDARAYAMAAAQAAELGVQIFGLGASGVGPEAEHLMREAALVTNGRYLFLTDDSAVGLGHAEPSVPCYRVTRLTNLMTRVLQSELTGRRHEPLGSDVIREVGSYRAGVCRE